MPKRFSKILETEPNNSFALYNIGVVYFKTGRLTEAAEALKKSVTIDSRDVKSRYQLAVVYEDLKQVEAAIMEYERVVSSGVDTEDVNKAKEKLEILKRHMTRKKGVESIALLLESGDIKGAIEETETLISKEERNEEAHLMLGRIYMRQGELDKAINSIKRQSA